MKGKVVLITGATNGIGLESARQLAKMGAKVVMVGRSAEKTKQVADQLKQENASADIDYLLADLSLMAQVHKLADEFKVKYNRLDVLLNNAGAMFTSRHVTAEGLEMTFALNHLSFFLLTNLLIDVLKANAPSRIINVSSDAHQVVRKTLDYDNLQGEKKFSAFGAYGFSKFENVMFTYELARRLQGTGVTANVLHPGFVRTGFGRNDSAFYRVVMSVLQFFGKTPEQGAATSVYLASSSEVEGITGKYFANCKAIASIASSYNTDEQKRLWEISEKITGLKTTI